MISEINFKDDHKYDYYGIYYDILFIRKRELSIKDYLKTFLPADSYVYDCDWLKEYIIMIPRDTKTDDLTRHIAKIFDMHSLGPADNDKAEEFKKIANFNITKQGVIYDKIK